MVCPCGRPQIFFIKEQIYLQAISWANNPACFIAGTLVLAKEGKKAIENIVPGDEVLAYDESTGDMQYKKVARVFRNTTDKWYHIHVNGEEIVCTPLHPFYVVGVGFKHAKDLLLTDLLLTSQGNCAKIQSIVVEKLSTPEVTYNFEVEDFHTYFVGDNTVLVHNTCIKTENALENIKYTEKVKKQMTIDINHGFPNMIDDIAGTYGKVGSFIGNDGIKRTAVEISGSINGKSGIFQYIIEPDGITVNHRLFTSVRNSLLR